MAINLFDVWALTTFIVSSLMLANEVLFIKLFPKLGESQVSFACEKLNEY